MVSLRRKKHTEASEGGKRRSARLLALEEQKSESFAFPILPVDTWQALDNGVKSTEKHGRRRQAREENQEESYLPVGGSDNGGSSSSRSTDRIIEYILDVLELKDTHELFTMPDDIQALDYLERVNRPGDFATLRQKHKDGMYMTLEQFENDVHMVFRKAMAINAQDTITYREAKCLQDQAKQVFQSLKNNRTYSELELSAWHQKYFSRQNRTKRNESLSYTKKAQDDRCKGHTVKERNVPITMMENKRCRLNDGFEYFKSCMVQRRYSYYAATNSSHPISAVCEQYKELVYNNFAPCYQESLQQFVRNAGTAAKAAAERKCLEYTQRLRSRDYAPNFHHPRSTTHGSSHSTCFLGHDVYCQTIDGTQASSSGDGPSCQLESDELLKLFSLIGTPEFLERCKSILAFNTAVAEPISDLSLQNWRVQPSMSRQLKEASTNRLMACSAKLGEPTTQERGKSILACNTNFQLISASDVGQKMAIAEPVCDLNSENWKIWPSICQQPREASTDRLLVSSLKLSEPRPQERGKSILAFNTNFQLISTSDVGQKTAMAELISDSCLENWKIRPSVCQQVREASTDQLLVSSPKLSQPRPQERGKSILALNTYFQLPSTSDVGQKMAIAEPVSDSSSENWKIQASMCRQRRQEPTNQSLVWAPKLGEPRTQTVRESSPFQLGFGQFARAIKPFEVGAQDIFAARSRE